MLKHFLIILALISCSTLSGCLEAGSVPENGIVERYTCTVPCISDYKSCIGKNGPAACTVPYRACFEDCNTEYKNPNWIAQCYQYYVTCLAGGNSLFCAQEYNVCVDRTFSD